MRLALWGASVRRADRRRGDMAVLQGSFGEVFFPWREQDGCLADTFWEQDGGLAVRGICADVPVTDYFYLHGRYELP